MRPDVSGLDDDRERERVGEGEREREGEGDGERAPEGPERSTSAGEGSGDGGERGTSPGDGMGGVEERGGEGEEEGGPSTPRVSPLRSSQSIGTPPRAEGETPAQPVEMPDSRVESPAEGLRVDVPGSPSAGGSGRRPLRARSMLLRTPDQVAGLASTPGGSGGPDTPASARHSLRSAATARSLAWRVRGEESPGSAEWRPGAWSRGPQLGRSSTLSPALMQRAVQRAAAMRADGSGALRRAREAVEGTGAAPGSAEEWRSLVEELAEEATERDAERESLVREVEALRERNKSLDKQLDIIRKAPLPGVGETPGRWSEMRARLKAEGKAAGVGDELVQAVEYQVSGRRT